jgi:hypothetical protein
MVMASPDIAQASQTVQTAQVAPSQAVQSVQASPPVKSVSQFRTVPLDQQMPQQRMEQTVPSRDTQDAPATDRTSNGANDQLYELLSDVRDLQQSAVHMEQRLHVLTGMVDAIEHKLTA